VDHILPLTDAQLRTLPQNRAFILGLFFLASATAFSLADSARATEPVQLIAYPQKLRTFYALTNEAVPKSLHAIPARLPVSQLIRPVKGTDGAVWLGTTQGLMRIDFSAPERDRRQYFAGQRYLPDDFVEQLIPDDHAGVWVRTRTGISHIELKPMTLAQKAEFFEQRIRARHDRYGLVASSSIPVAGDPSSHQLHDSDNDGLWTSIYAAAECFRYSVTKSPEALANARKSIEAILFLEEVAGRRGFPARSYMRKGDQLPSGGEWHWTADGQYYWKGDTSSDEIVGHFFIFSVAYDLLPDAKLKKRIAETAQRIMNHILEHNYQLIDLDGKRPLWGFWDPETLKQQPNERGLNSLQLLSFLKTTAHVTGEKRYEAEYAKAAHELNYTNWITRVNEFREELNYSDEELGMLPFYCVFKYEKDASLLKAYRSALDEWWKNIRREANPLWTFIYATANPQAAVDLHDAVWTLYRMPMDTIEYTVINSHRQDIEWASQPDRFGSKETLTLLPPDERPVMKWNNNPFVVDSGGGGGEEDDGAAFLLPYWMGRYHKLLAGE
jgi:hypothetical protein